MSIDTAARNWLIVGLGNVGSRYNGTRHNVGFDVLELFARAVGATGRRSQWSKGETLDARERDCKLTLLWPTTFMNASGEAVREVASFHHIEPAQIIVVHDDIDLPVGKLRVRLGGGDGGQKGVRSTIEQLGSADFVRVKFGVGRPPHPQFEVADWVLSRFSAEEKPAIEQALSKAVDAIRTIISEGYLKAQNRFNG